MRVESQVVFYSSPYVSLSTLRVLRVTLFAMSTCLTRSSCPEKELSHSNGVALAVQDAVRNGWPVGRYVLTAGTGAAAVACHQAPFAVAIAATIAQLRATADPPIMVHFSRGTTHALHRPPQINPLSLTRRNCI